MHLYISHPQVLIDPAVPVPNWPLSEAGRMRARNFARSPWLHRFGRVVSSLETKAIETAEIIAAALDIRAETFFGMHENDRSSTGFLPAAEFTATADAFFASPNTSIRGWETASDAQARIIKAVEAALSQQPEMPTIFVGHGGVGTLLQCHCAGWRIDRRYDQTDGGGCHFAFSLDPRIVHYPWRLMETGTELLS